MYVGIQHLARVNGVIGGSGKKYYYHNDHLGSALAVNDENGNKVVERDFTPFGERINTDVYDDEPRDLDEDESGFTGKDWDEDVGLYYYNARWYDFEIGRFISEDSEIDDPNGYGYCFNNPVNNIDPTGHFSVGMQSGLALFGAALNAVAILSKDEKLGVIASAFSLFVAVYSKHQAAKQAEIMMDNVENNEPMADPVEQVEAVTTPDGDTSNINTGNQEATQPPPADEAPKSTEETIQELEPAAPVETPAPVGEVTERPAAVVETKPAPKSSKEKIAAAYAEAKKLANATHEQLEVIAKNNQLTDAEFLYLCARYAFDDKRFDKKIITGKRVNPLTLGTIVLSL